MLGLQAVRLSLHNWSEVESEAHKERYEADRQDDDDNTTTDRSSFLTDSQDMLQDKEDLQEDKMLEDQGESSSMSEEEYKGTSWGVMPGSPSVVVSQKLLSP